MYAYDFRFYFTPLPGFFSPFPHGTCSLSVIREYLALEGGPPYSNSVSRAPPYSISHKSNFRVRDYHPVSSDFPDCSTIAKDSAVPRSLAATKGISVDFFSSRYLDVSVPPVRLLLLCIQSKIICLCRLGFPIRKFADQSLFENSPRLIASYNVLHRLLSPRHSPYALIHLTI